MKTNFEAEVAERLKNDRVYVGTVCCAKCAKDAVAYFIDKYPNYFITVCPGEGDSFIVSCSKTTLRAMVAEEDNE